MLPFPSYLLQQYYRASGWPDYNQYSRLTASSKALLDFSFEPGLHFSLSKSPVPSFAGSATLAALSPRPFDPIIQGSLSYFFARPDVLLSDSSSTSLGHLTERFRLPPRLHPPRQRPLYLQAGNAIDHRDYLLYGRLSLPSARVDGLCIYRLSQNLLSHVSFISTPSESSFAPPLPSSSASIAPAPTQPPPAHRVQPNIMFNLQHDAGRWSSEYSYSVADGMFGARVLHNFGSLLNSSTRPTREKRVDEEESLSRGLRGTFSAGAECFFSALESSGGLSAGIRFATLPEQQPHTQPPTIITATLNPIVGALSAAYAAKVSHDLTLCSRYNFNVYSYDSDWTMGLEWWQRPALNSHDSIKNVDDEDVEESLPNLFWRIASPSPLSSFSAAEPTGVLKARACTSKDVSLMWERKVGECLVGIGVVANFSSPGKPVRSLGLDIQYFGSSSSS